MTAELKDANFKSEVIDYKGYVLIDFWAPWCGPCKAVSPTVDAVAEEMGDKLKVFKMNIDENPEAPVKHGVRSIPTFILFKEGKPVSTKVGSLQKSAFIDWLNNNMAKA